MENHSTIEAFIRAFREDMHQYPELSNEEFQTTEKIKEALQKHQIRILDIPLKTGVVAEIGNPDSHIAVALRADIDALPIIEESEEGIISKKHGIMHACGHDFHTSAVLGAAILLKQNESDLKGKVIILFQAAEETGIGALSILKTGVLDPVSAIFGFHNDPTLPVGTLGSKQGALTAGVDRFNIKIIAKGAHAAKPHDGNDPIIIIGALINALQSIVSRNINSKQNAVLSITQVHSGSTWNVIPEQGFLEGTVRTFDSETRSLIENRAKEIIKGLSIAFGADIIVDWQAGPPSVLNDPKLTDYALAIAEKSGFNAVRLEESPIGEDFAFYQQKIRGAFMMIGSGGPYALHHPKFRVDDNALFPTAHYLYQLIENSFSNIN